MSKGADDRKLRDTSLHDSKLQEQYLSDEDIRGYNVNVKVKGLDHRGREISAKGGQMDELDVVAAYLKLINIPCMFDVGTTPINPSDQQLNLNIADDVTYHEVLKTELKNDLQGLKPTREIDQIKLAIEAIHTNLYCSEVEIVFNGYSTMLDGTRCIFDYASRDAMSKEKDKAKIIDPNEEATLNSNEHDQYYNAGVNDTTI